MSAEVYESEYKDAKWLNWNEQKSINKWTTYEWTIEWMNEWMNERQNGRMNANMFCCCPVLCRNIAQNWLFLLLNPRFLNGFCHLIKFNFIEPSIDQSQQTFINFYSVMYTYETNTYMYIIKYCSLWAEFSSFCNVLLNCS